MIIWSWLYVIIAHWYAAHYSMGNKNMRKNMYKPLSNQLQTLRMHNIKLQRHFRYTYM